MGVKTWPGINKSKTGHSAINLIKEKASAYFCLSLILRQEAAKSSTHLSSERRRQRGRWIQRVRDDRDVRVTRWEKNPSDLKLQKHESTWGEQTAESTLEEKLLECSVCEIVATWEICPGRRWEFNSCERN